MSALRVGVAVGGDEPIPAVVERAQRLDAGNALDHLWVADERFRRDVFATMGALAATTSRLTLVTSVTDPLIRHPALTGAAIATVAEAAPGRTILGLGAGVSGFSALGIHRDQPAIALRDTIDFLRHFWATAEHFEFARRTLEFHGGRLGFAPTGPIPIYLAGRGPRILELAGELADGVLVATFLDGPLLEGSLARVAAGEARRHPALGPLHRVSWAYTSIDDDREAARNAVRTGIAVALWGSRQIIEDLGIALPVALVRLMEEQPYSIEHETIDRAAALIPDELVDACSIAGPPAEVAGRLHALAGRGFSDVACWLFETRNVPHGPMVERLANEVVPRLRALEGTA